MQVQTKVFYFDIKANSRGRYLKISEKGRNRPKSSVVVPLRCLPQFVALVDYYMLETANGRLGIARDLVADTKVFSFCGGENDRGRFLRIFESGGGFPLGGSSLMIAAGGQLSDLSAFGACVHNVLAFVNEFSVQDLDASDVAGPSAMPYFTAGPGVTPDTVSLEATREGTPVLSVGSKHFFFDLRTNERGPYLRVKEVSGNLRNMLVIPLLAVSRFQEAIRLAVLTVPIRDAAPGGGAGPSNFPAPGSQQWHRRA